MRRWISPAPGDPFFLELKGQILLESGKAQEALPLLEKAVRLDPQLEEAHFQLGKALALLGRGRDADASFERCFALSPVRRMMVLAAEHQQAGRLQDAEQLCRQVLQKNPRHVDALRLLAETPQQNALPDVTLTALGRVLDDLVRLGGNDLRRTVEGLREELAFAKGRSLEGVLSGV